MNNSLSFHDFMPTVDLPDCAPNQIVSDGYVCAIPVEDGMPLKGFLESAQGGLLSEQEFSSLSDSPVYFLMGRYNGKVLDIIINSIHDDDYLPLVNFCAVKGNETRKSEDFSLTKNLIMMICVASIVAFAISKVSGYDLVNPLLSAVVSMLSFFLLVVILVKEKEDNGQPIPSSSRALSI